MYIYSVYIYICVTSKKTRHTKGMGEENARLQKKIFSLKNCQEKIFVVLIIASDQKIIQLFNEAKNTRTRERWNADTIKLTLEALVVLIIASDQKIIQPFNDTKKARTLERWKIYKRRSEVEEDKYFMKFWFSKKVSRKSSSQNYSS